MCTVNTSGAKGNDVSRQGPPVQVDLATEKDAFCSMEFEVELDAVVEEGKDNSQKFVDVGGLCARMSPIQTRAFFVYVSRSVGDSDEWKYMTASVLPCWTQVGE